MRGNAATEAQARNELAVIHGASAKRALGHADAAAEVGDLLQQLFVIRAVPYLCERRSLNWRVHEPLLVSRVD
jgi:hypothetical protein